MKIKRVASSLHEHLIVQLCHLNLGTIVTQNGLDQTVKISVMKRPS